MGTHSQTALILRLSESMLTQQQRAQNNDAGALGDLTRTAVTLLPAVDHAAITVLHPGGTLETMGSTTDDPVILDRVQSECGEGPALSTTQQRIIRVDDLASEHRWPRYRDEALTLTPVRSLVCFRLFSDHRGLVAFTLYADRASVIDDEVLEAGLLYATHAAAVWQLVRRDEQFRSALASRDLIGQAKGMIMERFGIDADQAFKVLKRLSQNSNTPVAEVAEQLVRGPR